MIGCVVKAKEVFAFAAPPAVLRAEVDIALKAKFFIVVFAVVHSASV